MAQFQVLTNAGTTQVQIAILHADIIATIGIVLNGKGRRLTLAQHIQFSAQNLDITRVHLGVLRLTLADDTSGLNAPFTP